MAASPESLPPPAPAWTDFQRWLVYELTDEQRNAVCLAPSESALVVAGAGTGKTRTLTTRLAWLATMGVRLDRILAVTFTNHAAQEIRNRTLAQFALAPGAPPNVPLPATGTFHAIAARLLRRHAETIGDHLGFALTARFTIMNDDEIVRAIKNAALAILPPGSLLRLTTDDAHTLAAALDHHATREPDPQILAERLERDRIECHFRRPRGCETDTRPACEIVRAYIRYKTEHLAFDYNDLIQLAVRALEINPALAGTYEALLVDEYQDTNRLQDRFLQLLRNRPGREPAPLYAVGDPSQSLYSWRGAQIENIRGLPERIACRVHHLTQNFRSSQPILNVANAAVANNRQHHHRTLRALGSRHETEPVAVHALPDPKKEAQFIVRTVQAHLEHPRTAPRDIAILARTGRALALIDPVLAQAGIPYRISAGRRLAERAEIRDATAWLRLLCNPADDAACERILVRPRRGIGEASIGKLRQYAAVRAQPMIDCARALVAAGTYKGKAGEGFRRILAIHARLLALADSRPSPRTLLDAILTDTGIRAEIEAELHSEDSGQVQIAREKTQRLSELLDLADDQTTIIGLNDHLTTADSARDHAGSNAVTLGTVHSAKGREWPLVILARFETDILPLATARALEDLEEERRVLHVAATRAINRLVITRSRMHRGRPIPPSTFLSELRDTVTEIRHH